MRVWRSTAGASELQLDAVQPVSGRPPIADLRSRLLQVSRGDTIAESAILATAEPPNGDAVDWIEQVDRRWASMWAPPNLQALLQANDYRSVVISTEFPLHLGNLREEFRQYLPFELLRRVEKAVRAAYPSRSEPLLEVVEGWLGVGGPRTCSLCGRTLRHSGAVLTEVCETCAHMRKPGDLPTEAVLAESTRALREFGGEHGEQTAAEIERYWQASHMRTVASAECVVCKTAGSAVVGRNTICFQCLSAMKIPVG